MEKLFSRETLRRVGLASALFLGAGAVAGCGSGTYSPPTIESLQEEGKYFELQRPDGSIMLCWSFLEKGSAGYAGYSWMAVTCDWDGDYTGPATTPTTEVPTTLPTVETIG